MTEPGPLKNCVEGLFLSHLLSGAMPPMDCGMFGSLVQQ